MSNKISRKIESSIKLIRLRSLEVLELVGALCASCRRDEDRVLRKLKANRTTIPYARERDLDTFFAQSMYLRVMLQSRMMQASESGWQELGRRGTPCSWPQVCAYTSKLSEDVMIFKTQSSRTIVSPVRTGTPFSGPKLSHMLQSLEERQAILSLKI